MTAHTALSLSANRRRNERMNSAVGAAVAAAGEGHGDAYEVLLRALIHIRGEGDMRPVFDALLSLHRADPRDYQGYAHDLLDAERLLIVGGGAALEHLDNTKVEE